MKFLTKPEIWNYFAHVASRSGPAAIGCKAFFTGCHLAGSSPVVNGFGNLAARQDCPVDTVHMGLEPFKKFIDASICGFGAITNLPKNISETFDKEQRGKDAGWGKPENCCSVIGDRLPH